MQRAKIFRETIGTILPSTGPLCDPPSAMAFPVPDYHPKPGAEPPAMVRDMTREDVQWNRRIFRPPPLDIHPQGFDATIFARDLRRIGLVHR